MIGGIFIIGIISFAFLLRGAYIYSLLVGTDVYGGGFQVEPTRQAGSSALVSTTEWMTQDGVAVNFSIPEGWRVTRESEGVLSSNLYRPSSAAAIDGGDLVTPPDITVLLLQNDTELPLSEFTHSYGDGWFSNYTEMRAYSIDGHDVPLFSDTSAAISRSPMRAAFVSSGTLIVLVTAEHRDEPAFDRIIESLNIVRVEKSGG